MKISKLLNKKNFFITLIFFFSLFLKGNSTEPIDIWNLENSKLKTKEKELEKNEDEISTKNSIYEMQSQKKNNLLLNKMRHYYLKKLILWAYMILQKIV